MSSSRIRWIPAASPAILAALASLAFACGGTENLPYVDFDATDLGADSTTADTPAEDPGQGVDTGRDPGTPPVDSLQDPGTPPVDSSEDPGTPNDPGTPSDPGTDIAPECKDSSACALGNICFEDKCVPGCGSDRDCAGGRHCVPESIPHGFCAQCITNDHCSAAAHEKCVSGSCVTTCQTNNDCAVQTNAPYCDTNAGTCVQCLSDGVCPIGTLCITNKCQSGCRSDRDCPDSLKCDPKSGANGGCFTCVQNADCNGRICKDHQCVIDCSVVQCTVDRPVCDPATGGCVQCLAKADCPAGNLCLGSRCIVGCETDNDCSGGRKCASGTCVQCITDEQCPLKQKCLQNQCLSTECARDTDCGGGKYCHPLLQSCEVLPSKYCISDDDCPAGYPPIIPAQMCDPLTRACIPSCTSGLGIPLCIDLFGGGGSQTVCVDNGCYECGTDNDCAGTRCDPYDRHCLVCKTDADCSVPTWHCDPATSGCKECLNDSQCTYPKVCDEAGGYSCVECLKDVDCKSPGKPVCGKSKVCIAPCSNECSNGNTVCNPGDTTEPIGLLTCGDYDDDPCLEYGGASECGIGTSCRTQAGGLGKCICQNACTSGQKRCQSGTTMNTEICTQNSNGCWYWSTGYCGFEEVCSGGTCVCNNTCVEGTKACDATYSDQIDICAVDPNGYTDCLHWQAYSYCNSGYICKNKVCSLP
jgi:hypothetical protein